MNVEPQNIEQANFEGKKTLPCKFLPGMIQRQLVAPLGWKPQSRWD